MPGRSAPRSLGVTELIAMGVGGMIGGGIFSILGLAVETAGHAAPLAFVVGSLVALTAGYSYVGLALRYRSDGASFTYLERAFPSQLWVAGIGGWTVVVGYIGTLALYAFTFGAYGAHLLGLEGVPLARGALAVVVLLGLAAVNLRGAAAMGRAEDIAVYVKITLLAILAGVGMTTVEPERIRPLFDRGVPSVFLAGALVFVAYEGFQLITNAVLESRAPERDIPRGIYGSIAITSLIYVAIAFVAVGSLDPQEIGDAGEYALAVVARPAMGRLGVVLVDIAALLATASAINATVFGASRLASEMATEHLAPTVFSFRNRHRVPWIGVSAITALGIALTLIGGLEFIAAFSRMTFLLVSIAVSVANLRLRHETGSRLLPIVAGLVLMCVTVGLLVVELLRNDRAALIACVAIYGATAASHLAFSRMRQRSRPQPAHDCE